MIHLLSEEPDMASVRWKIITQRGFENCAAELRASFWSQSFRSSSPLPSLSRWLNSASMKFSHSCFDILIPPFLSCHSYRCPAEAAVV